MHRAPGLPAEEKPAPDRYGPTSLLLDLSHDCPRHCLLVLGVVGPTARRNRLVSFASVFIEMNWAAVRAMRTWPAGGVTAQWETT